MSSRTKLSLVGLGAVSTGIGLAALRSSNRWNRKTQQIIDKLTQPSRASEPVSFDDFAQLPLPVAKYLRYALREGQTPVCSVRIRQVGEFCASEKARDKWMPFTATQFVSAQPPGFVWDARLRAAFGMQIRVRDAYVEGQGSGQVSLFALVTIAQEQGGSELAQGSLLRYLAEAVWCPTALLPSENLVWSAIDDTTALATLTDNGVCVALQFSFNDAGEVINVYTPERAYKKVSGASQRQPWQCILRDYQQKGGMMIPLYGEAQWHLPDGKYSYFKGRSVEMQFDFAR